ncbi:hypothetical protein [Enterococcus sp.]|uniref:hypothetical protein n=1 Tax=Enterococcus sp. TaxID=35783 RepID=UPI002FC5A3DA
MKLNDKEKRQKNKKETAKRNFRYNRYLLLRYSLATLFFTNLYWGLTLYVIQQKTVILPLSLFVFSIGAISEHVKLYGDNKDVEPQLKMNGYYHIIQLFTNSFLIISTVLSFDFTRFFPFLKNTIQARALLVLVLLLGIVLSAICLKRIFAINKNQDKHYQYIKEFEKAYK